MKRLLAVLVLTGASVNAETHTNSSGIWSYSILNGEARITKYTGTGGAVIIPSKVGLGEIPVAVVGQDPSQPNYKSVFGELFPNDSNYNTSVTSITIQNGVKNIDRGAFFNMANLASVIVPESVTSIGNDAFEACPNITNIVVPSRFMTQLSRIGLKDSLPAQAATDYFLSALATNEAFVTAVASKILAASNNYGLATQSGVSNTITATTSNLVTQSEILTLVTKTELTNALTQSRTDGINSVLSNPNLWTLYTTNQIHAMAIGDLVLTSTNNGQFVLNYDIEQSEDLVNWAPYQGFAMPLNNLPTNKAFVRIKAKQ